MMYGQKGFPEWGTSFAEIECDSKEVGHEVIRLLMEQTVADQATEVPPAAARPKTGEPAQRVGTQERQLETESGPISWSEPKASLPQSRKAFFPSGHGSGPPG